MRYLLWSLLLVCSSAYSQTDPPVKPGTEYDGVAGSPFLLKDWAKGTVYYKSGRVVKQFKLKYDCCRNYLLLEFEGQSFAPQMGSITNFVLYPKDNDSLVFKKGFPSVDRFNAETFYQVLLPARATLLKIFTKNIMEEKGLLPSTTKRYFEEEEMFFLLVDGNLTMLAEGDREKLAAQFPDKQEALLRFLNEQSLKMRNQEDFMKFAEKFNELLQPASK